MIKLTSNINDEILRELIDRSPECHRPCSTCEKPEGMSCTECAKNGNCFKMLSNFNDYVMFSTGTNALGFQFAITKRTILNMINNDEYPWKTKSVEDIIDICSKNNLELVNEEALTLFGLVKNYSVFNEYKEPTEILGKAYFWRRYSDASGHLENVHGKSVVAYNIFTPDEIEYRFAKGADWEWFYGTFEEFKAFAERAVKRQRDL